MNANPFDVFAREWEELKARVAALENQSSSCEEDGAVDAKEAAEILGVSQWRVYEMVKRGLLQAYRPSPKRLLITRRAIREFQQGKAA